MRSTAADDGCRRVGWRCCDATVESAADGAADGMLGGLANAYGTASGVTLAAQRTAEDSTVTCTAGGIADRPVDGDSISTDNAAGADKCRPNRLGCASVCPILQMNSWLKLMVQPP